eukprot:scaffold114539_cov44-Attheya_sp.AAC.1
MVLRPGGGGGGGGDDGERRCIRIVEGAVLDFVSLQYVPVLYCSPRGGGAAQFYYSQIKISRLSSTTDLFHELVDFWNRL